MSVSPLLTSLEEVFNCCCHRRGLWRRSLDIQPQTCLRYSVTGLWTKGTYKVFALDVIGEVLLERCNSLRAEKYDEVVILNLNLMKVTTDGAVESRNLIRQLNFVHHARYLVVVRVRQRHQVLLVFMLLHDINQLRELIHAMEDLSLSIDDVFLQVYCDRLRDAEIFHRFWNSYPQLSAQTEEMVNRYLTREDDCCVRQDVHFLLAERLGVYAINLSERAEVYRHAVVVCQLKIWRLGVGWRRQ